MKNRRAYILLFAAVTFAGVSQAMGQGYIGSVLYPLPVPNGATTIRGFGVSASQTVGQTYYPTGGPDHALLWTTAGVIDLHPTNLGMDRSVAYGTSGSQQVGAGEGSGTDTNYHALLWTGSAASVVDLNPTALPESTSHSPSLPMVPSKWATATTVFLVMPTPYSGKARQPARSIYRPSPWVESPFRRPSPPTARNKWAGVRGQRVISLMPSSGQAPLRVLSI